MKFYEFKGRKIQCSFSFDEREFQSEFQKQQQKPNALVKKNKKMEKQMEKKVFFYTFFLDFFFLEKSGKNVFFLEIFFWKFSVVEQGGGVRAARSKSQSRPLRIARPPPQCFYSCFWCTKKITKNTKKNGGNPSVPYLVL